MDHQDIIFLVGLFMGSTGGLIFQAVRPRRAPRGMPPLPPRTMEQEMQYRQYLATMPHKHSWNPSEDYAAALQADYEQYQDEIKKTNSPLGLG
jgi:hypothetical protein